MAYRTGPIRYLRKNTVFEALGGNLLEYADSLASVVIVRSPNRAKIPVPVM